MISAITTKLEIDVMQAGELLSACQLASTHSMPAIVVHSQLTGPAYATRGKFRGNFKIITPVDWPKGEIFGITKLRGLNRENFESDGFEIMLTGGKNENENRNEARVISEFIRNNISKTAEIRFVLGCFVRSDADFLKMCKVIKDIPMPAFIRTDHHLKAQAAKASAKAQMALMEQIREVTPCPLKISGNIDSVKTLVTCIEQSGGTGAARFAVSPQQAQSIITDLKKQPDLRKVLETNA